MEKYIYDEKNSLWYELQGDYYLPCLKLPEEEQQPVGLWGQRHLRYIKQNQDLQGPGLIQHPDQQGVKIVHRVPPLDT